jgi:FG-GAP repeat protein
VLVGLAMLTTVTAHAQGKRKVASSNPGGLSFLPVVTHDPGGPQAAMVVVADVNGDGKPDLIVLNCGNCYGLSSITNPGSVGIMLATEMVPFRKR